MSRLETRIEKLEAVAPGVEPPSVIIKPVSAMCRNGHRIPLGTLGRLLAVGPVRRKAGETEGELMERACAQERGVLVEDREKPDCPECGKQEAPSPGGHLIRAIQQRIGGRSA